VVIVYSFLHRPAGLFKLTVDVVAGDLFRRFVHYVGSL
jgi:hypothetical protein